MRNVGLGWKLLECRLSIAKFQQLPGEFLTHLRRGRRRELPVEGCAECVDGILAFVEISTDMADHPVGSAVGRIEFCHPFKMTDRLDDGPLVVGDSGKSSMAIRLVWGQPNCLAKGRIGLRKSSLGKQIPAAGHIVTGDCGGLASGLLVLGPQT